MSGDDESVRGSRELTVAAINHVRLVYEYLNARDLDGLGSLYAPDLVRLVPHRDPIVGRAALSRFHQEDKAFSGVRHRVRDVLAHGRRLAVRGVMVGGECPEMKFADLFVVGTDALIVEHESYFHPPNPCDVP